MRLTASPSPTQVLNAIGNKVGEVAKVRTKLVTSQMRFHRLQQIIIRMLGRVIWESVIVVQVALKRTGTLNLIVEHELFMPLWNFAFLFI